MGALGFDLETTKIPRHYPYSEGSYPVMACLSYEDGTSRTFIFNHEEEPNVNQRWCLQQIQEAFNQAAVLVGHNLKFDLLWALYLGLEFGHCKLYCTMLAEYLLAGQVHQDYSLDGTCERRGLPRKLDVVKTFWEAGTETDQIPLEVLTPYVVRDTELTLALRKQQLVEVKQKGLGKLITLQMETLRCLVDVEHNGMAVCCNRMEGYIAQLRVRAEELEEALHRVLGWPCALGSNDELSVALYGGTLQKEETQAYITTRQCKLKEEYTFTYKSGLRAQKVRSRTVQELVVKTRKIRVPEYREGLGFAPPVNSKAKKSTDREDSESFWSVDKNTIAFLKARTKAQRAAKELLIEYSNVVKAYESFLGKTDDAGLANKIQPDGCLHGHYNQCVVATGRLSCTTPNLQNLPRKGTSPVKRIFIPRNQGWKITNADLAQLEWRVAAFLSQDPVAVQEILDDIDYHRDNAIRFFGADPNLPNDHPDFKPLRTAAKVFGFRLLRLEPSWGNPC